MKRLKPTEKKRKSKCIGKSISRWDKWICRYITCSKVWKLKSPFRILKRCKLTDASTIWDGILFREKLKSMKIKSISIKARKNHLQELKSITAEYFVNIYRISCNSMCKKIETINFGTQKTKSISTNTALLVTMTQNSIRTTLFGTNG